MRKQIVLVGIGGQGVLLATKVIAEAALARQVAVIGSETHGMSQRGGSVTSHLRLGAFDGPIVRRGDADVLIGMSRDETLRGLGFLRPGGIVVANLRAGEAIPTEMGAILERHGINWVQVRALDKAVELGNPKLTNLVLIGAAVGRDALPFTLEEILEILPGTVPPRFLESNIEALREGVALAEG